MRAKGFTLIELLIVVAIIAILAAIAVPNFLEAQTRSKAARAVADMRTMATAIESYMVDNNHYPPFEAYNNRGFTIGPSAVYANIPEAISSRQIYFTTPVSYITSILPEAFKVTRALADEEPEFYDTYDFVAAKQFDGSGIGWTADVIYESGASSGAGWRLCSAGPDLIQAYGGLTIADDVDPGSANDLGCDYDATNGTLSAGDIVRIGGGSAHAPLDELPYYDRVGGRIGLP